MKGHQLRVSLPSRLKRQRKHVLNREAKWRPAWAAATCGGIRGLFQTQSVVTLSDLNVTPMLDLAFVLLIIFVLLPVIRAGDEVRIAEGGSADTMIKRDDVRTVEVSRSVNIYWISRWRCFSLKELRNSWGEPGYSGLYSCWPTRAK